MFKIEEISWNYLVKKLESLNFIILVTTKLLLFIILILSVDDSTNTRQRWVASHGCSGCRFCRLQKTSVQILSVKNVRCVDYYIRESLPLAYLRIFPNPKVLKKISTVYRQVSCQIWIFPSRNSSEKSVVLTLSSDKIWSKSYFQDVSSKHEF